MVAQFVKALKQGQGAPPQEDGEHQETLAREVGHAQRQVMLETPRVWKKDLFPDGGRDLDESDIIADAPFPPGEMGYNLARFEAWHAGYITDEVVCRAGGVGLLMWFRKLAVIKRDPGVPGLARLEGAEGGDAKETAESASLDTLGAGSSGEGNGGMEEETAVAETTATTAVEGGEAGHMVVAVEAAANHGALDGAVPDGLGPDGGRSSELVQQEPGQTESEVEGLGSG